MDRTATNQAYKCLTKAAAELRGIGARLRASEPSSTEALEAAAAAILNLWPDLRHLASDEQPTEANHE